MAISDVNRDAVFRAVEEYDRLGGEQFLKEYGFGRATRYLLRLDGRDYDSKAIVGVAHKFARPDQGPLPASTFAGGKAAAAGTLERLGFAIVDTGPTRNPDWTRDELILATEFYRMHAPSIPGKTGTRLIKLSDEIRAVAGSLGLHGNDTFRNANGVYMKLMELRKYDPDYTGKGLGRKLRQIEQEVWDLDPSELAASAAAIRTSLQAIAVGTIRTEGVTDVVEPEVAEASEGALLTRIHRYRERDRSIVKRKKQEFLKKHGRLFCEACGFDFEERYGERGSGFIECHHTRPISEMEPGGMTKLSELVLVCANCHRMIHAKRPWFEITELRSLIRPDR